MEIAIGLLKFGLLLFALLLVPLALVLSTPFVLLWPRRHKTSWTTAIVARYCTVARHTWAVSQIIDAIVPS